MEEKKSKLIALVGDLTNDSNSVSILEQELKETNEKFGFFTKLDKEATLKSVVIILNKKSLYGPETNSFVHSAIEKKYL